VGLLGVERAWGPGFLQAVLRANFEDDADVADPAVLDDLLAKLGLDGPAIREEAVSPAWRPRLREATEAAAKLGVFGAPTFMVGGEMFWGNDRLEQALAYATEATGSR
jgi:2-hydroxychromene-2-carboxylate isomerase